MPALKMTVNVPVHASLKFADIVPGNFGPQVRLKGSFDGADGMLFLPGKVWANLKALKAAGVVAHGDYNEEPTEPVELPLLHRDVVLTRSQPAGAKYAELTVQTNGVAPVQSTPKPQGKQPVTLGGPLPGEYDEPPHPAEAYSQTHAIAADPFSPTTVRIAAAAQAWDAARKMVLVAAPDFGEDLQALNAACATILIQASKAA